MKNLKDIKSSVKSNSYLYFVYIPSVVLIFLMIMLMLCYPKAVSQGVSNGIGICVDTLLPSIFPFMFFSSLVMNLRLFDGFFGKMTAFTKMLFNLPPVAMPIIIMSVIGGYPVGAFLVKEAFEKGRISSLEGKRMLLFCVNPGIGFTYSMIGCTLFGSMIMGVIFFLVSVLSAVIIGLFSRFYEDGTDYKKEKVNIASSDSVSESLIASMNASVRNTVNVSVWVIIFSCTSALADVLPLSKSSSDILKMLCEVTNGVIISKEGYSVFVLSAVVGFCGFCIHMQIMPSLSALKMKYSHFLCSRILTSGLYCVLTGVFLNIFSVEAETALIGTAPEKAEIHSSVSLCVFLMIMCGLFVLGDGFTAYIREKNMSSDNRNGTDLY